MVPNELSFLPDDYLENKAQRRANAICAVLFLITMVSIGTAFSTSEHSLKEVEEQHSKIEREFTEAANRIQQVQQMQEKQRTMATQAELTASLLEKVPRSIVLARITNALPAGVSLTDLSLDSRKRQSTKNGNGAPKTAFEIKRAQNGGASSDANLFDVTMHLTGLAPTDVQVAEFIRRLNALNLMSDVNLIISDWEGQRNREQVAQYRKFQIEMTLNPDADVQNDASLTKTATAAAVDSRN